MPFPGRSIERVLRDFATPSNNLTAGDATLMPHESFGTALSDFLKPAAGLLYTFV